jgi:BlaI family penicillinase repressor
MGEANIALTEAEWEVMECLWAHAPCTGREVVQYLAEKMGWARSTSLTLLRRLEAKGAVAEEAGGEVKTFRPVLLKEEAAVRETENLLGRAYHGSLSLLVSAMTRRQRLSQAEIDELYELLREMEAKHD